MEYERYLRRTEVEALTGLSRASIYRYMSEGRFIRPYRIGKSAVRWRYSEIQAWLAARPQTGGGWLLSRSVRDGGLPYSKRLQNALRSPLGANLLIQAG